MIPSNPVLYSARMEDGYALADASLRTRLPRGCSSGRRGGGRFLADVLGIEVSEDGMVMPEALAVQTNGWGFVVVARWTRRTVVQRCEAAD